MKKLALAVAASTSVLAGSVLLAAPANATIDLTDLCVTSTKTGGILGVFGTGAGTVSNKGTTVIPAGTVMKIDVGDMPGLPDEIHANSVSFADSSFASVTPTDLVQQKWQIVTKKDLYPGQVQSYKYTVLHYAPWHRVKHSIDVVSIPGMSDGNKDNDTAAGLNL